MNPESNHEPATVTTVNGCPDTASGLNPNVVAQVATLLGKPSTRASGKQPASGAPRPPGLPTVAFATTDLDGAGDDATADTDNGRRCAAVEHQINKQVA